MFGTTSSCFGPDASAEDEIKARRGPPRRRRNPRGTPPPTQTTGRPRYHESGVRRELAMLRNDLAALKSRIERASSTSKARVRKQEEDEEVAMEEQPPVLQWKEDLGDWLGTRDEPVLETLESDMLSGVVAGVEDPSLFLLLSTRDTFGIEGSENMDYAQKIRHANMVSVTVTFTTAMLAFLTIILPMVMLANFYKRVAFFDFTIDSVDESRHMVRERHKAFLKITSAVLLAYLLGTSVAVLEEVKVFRFFLLCMEPPKTPKLFENGASQDANLFEKTLQLTKGVGGMIFAKDPLSKPILCVGMLSKIISLLTVFQLTFLIFRVEGSATGMILNSVALQFLLETDRTLVTALKSTRALRQFYATAVLQLRDQAEGIAAQPRLVTAFVEPFTMKFSDICRQSISNQYAERLAKKYPRMLSWLVPKDGGDDDAPCNASVQGLDGLSEDARAKAVNQFRRSCRSEVLHRVIARVIYVYGGVIIFLQVFANFVCSFGVCKPLIEAQGFDDEE